MIALCPECKTRYRLAREKIGPQGARIRCSKCQTVFRVQVPKPAPEAAKGTPQQSASQPQPQPQLQRPAPAPQEEALPARKFVARALVAEADRDTAIRIADCLTRWRIMADVVEDGGEALLRLFRQPPDLAILGGHLPGVSSPIIAEIARRADELRITPLVRIAPMDEPAGTPEFEANEVIEPGQIADGLGAIFQRLSVGVPPAAAGVAAKLPVEVPEPAAASAPSPAPEPVPAPVSEPVAAAGPPSGAATEPPPRRRRTNASSSDDPAVVSAERLARIAVSDIILYNEEKFAKGVGGGNVTATLESELAEARHMFEQRIPEEVRAKRDFLVEELERRAAARS
ncbi:MAG: zinc-ribbon domain-containing protein [Myxococcota bacterium]